MLTEDSIIKAFCIHTKDYIEILMVAFEQHRTGFGTRLLAYMEEQLFSLGHATLRLETFKHNRQAVNFYLKNGWGLVREDVNEDIGLAQVFFEKSRGG